MPVQLVCKCGKQLYVPDGHAGRRVKCPGCGESHLAPAEAPSASTPSLPYAHARSGQGGRRLPLLLVGLLLLLSIGFAAWWFLFRQAGPAQDGDDLALIPANAQGFATVRLAELWKSPAVEKALQKRDKAEEDPAERMDRETGLRPAEVERFTIVGVDASKRLGWVVVRAGEPLDRQKILSRLKNGSEHVHEGQSYFKGAGPDGDERAIHFVGRRVLVAGNEAGVKRCLDFTTGPPVKGPLGPVIALAGGTRSAVAGFVPAGGALDMAKGIGAAKSLEKVKLMTATLDVTDEAKLEVTAKLASADEATELARTIDGYQKPLRENALQRNLLSFGLRFYLGKNLAPLAPTLVNLLAKAKVEPNGDEITAKADLSQAGVARLIQVLAAQK
jgi:hypothetical protein